MEREGGGKRGVAKLVGIGDFKDSFVWRISLGDGLEMYGGPGCRNCQLGLARGSS